MNDIIKWMILSKDNQTENKMAALAKSFSKHSPKVDMTSETAKECIRDAQAAYAFGAEIVTYLDDDYPDDLRHIYHPPAYLYVKGNKKLLKSPLMVTIVGSREATAYGLNIASSFAYELSENNICIVSGGARGIDSAALKGALRGKKGVVCVLGTGIDVVYPKENKKLFDRIVENGVLVSEFPPQMPPLAQNFPVRNRIMTALAQSVCVVEAAEKSGALISASHAAEQGKTVFAVPGNIDSPTSKGTNDLLRDGAMWAITPEDIQYELLERLPDNYRMAMMEQYETEEQKQDILEFNDFNNFIDFNTEKLKVAEEKAEPLSATETAVINAIKKGMTSYDSIAEHTAAVPQKLTATLSMMELKGIIKCVRGQYELDE